MQITCTQIEKNSKDFKAFGRESFYACHVPMINPG